MVGLEENVAYVCRHARAAVAELNLHALLDRLRVDEIGEMEFWIPKSKIIKWEGKTEIILKMI